MKKIKPEDMARADTEFIGTISKSGAEITPELVKAAIDIKAKKKRKWLYRANEAVSEHIGKFTIATIIFVAVTCRDIILAWSKGLF